MAEYSENEKEIASRGEAVHIEEAAPAGPKTMQERREEKQRKQEELLEQQRKEQERKKHEQEIKRRRKKRKLIIPGFVLFSCAIASITMALSGYENERMLKILLCVLLISWIAGALIHYMFERFARQNEEALSEDGEVINKGLISPDEDNGDIHG